MCIRDSLGSGRPHLVLRSKCRRVAEVRQKAGFRSRRHRLILPPAAGNRSQTAMAGAGDPQVPPASSIKRPLTWVIDDWPGVKPRTPRPGERSQPEPDSSPRRRWEGFVCSSTPAASAAGQYRGGEAADGERGRALAPAALAAGVLEHTNPSQRLRGELSGSGWDRSPGRGVRGFTPGQSSLTHFSGRLIDEAGGTYGSPAPTTAV